MFIVRQVNKTFHWLIENVNTTFFIYYYFLQYLKKEKKKLFLQYYKT